MREGASAPLNCMAYADHLIVLINELDEGVAKKFFVEAMRLDYNISELARMLKAQRNTLYRWMRGYSISNAYQEKVSFFANTFTECSDKEEAWTRIRRASFLQPYQPKNSSVTPE